MLKAKMGEAVKRPATDSRDTYSFFHPSRFVRHLRLWIGPRERLFFSSLFRLSLYIFMAKPFHNNSEKEWNKYFCFISLRVKCSESFSFFFFLFFGRMPGWIVLSYKPVTRQGRTLERERQDNTTTTTTGFSGCSFCVADVQPSKKARRVPE